jgi:DNA mismatch repair protein MutS2
MKTSAQGGQIQARKQRHEERKKNRKADEQKAADALRQAATKAC